MRLLEAAPVVADAAGEPRGLDRRLRWRFHVAEQPLGQLEQRIGIDPAARRQHQSRGRELVGKPVETILPVRSADRRFGAQHRAADRLSLERGFEQMIVDEVVGRIDAFAKLGQDHLLLALEMGLVEMRRPQQVGDELRHQRQVAAERPPMEHRLVARGPRVE